MKTFIPKSSIRIACVVVLLAGWHAQTWAQSVFKCTVANQTVYQATPCEGQGQGKALTIAPGPTEQQIQEAKQRADADKAKAASNQAQAQAAQRTDAQPVVGKADCARLNKDRADAFGRRNATVRDSRNTNINQSSAVDRYQDEIRRIEGQMVKAGCRPT